MIRNGIGFDVHAFAAGRRLVLGGIVIPHPAGLAGHSDADVLSHAAADALLGAVADGDIGEHFPDSDPRWKDADSLVILAETARRVARLQAHILNLDVTVIAEQPRLAPYREAIREKLAATLDLPPGRISVKATTTEGLGSLGRREGIAALAIATVEQAAP